jgi:hypothetical protein
MALKDLRWQLAIRMTIPLSCEQIDLLLCKVGVNHGKWDAMESTIPCSKEGVFPGIRHGKDVINVQMLPLSVSDGFPFRGRRRLGGITVRPLVPDELVVLFTPHHSSERLALNVA